MDEVLGKARIVTSKLMESKVLFSKIIREIHNSLSDYILGKEVTNACGRFTIPNRELARQARM
jgi:hypothetical protein